MSDTASSAAVGDDEETRRDFLLISTVTVGAVGVAFAAWPFIDSMNPSKDVVAMSSTELDLAPVEEGQAITLVWRGKPVFIRHRTKAEIDRAKKEDDDRLPDPAKDSERVQKGKEIWLVMVGICTHLGCIPLGQRDGEPKGEWNGWFCPCHGSHYDTSGRIRKGPAPRNLDIPPYTFLSNTTVRIG